MPTQVADRLVNRLRVARAERDLSQGELARSAGVSRQTISSIRPASTAPSTVLALRLARTFGGALSNVLFWLEGEDQCVACAP